METDPSKSPGHYIHRINYNRRERMVGVFVFFALVLFAALIIISGNSQHLFEKRVTFYIDVNSGEGINEGSTVRLLGAEVGEVSDLSLAHGRKIHVALEIYQGDQALIRSDAKVVINRLVTIGNASIEIEPGSINAPMLSDGSTIPVEETPSLNELVLNIARLFQSLDTDLLTQLDTMLPKLEKTVDNAQKIIAQIASGQGTLGAAVFDTSVEQEMRQVVESGAQILSEAEGIVSIASQRLVELKPVISGTAHVINDLQGTTQNLPEIIADLKKTITLTHTALNLLNEELHHLPGTVFEARRTLNRADSLLEGAQDQWPLSTLVQEPSFSPLIPVQPTYE